MVDTGVKRVSRRYDNSGRAVQAAANRAAVLDATAQLLVDKGYSGTTMAAVARAAGVSVETVYKTFGTKPALVREVLGAAVVGDDEPVALIDRADMQAALHAPNGVEIVDAFVRAACDILVRLGRLLATLLVAARAGEPELSAIAEQAGQQRLADLTRVIDAIATAGDLRTDLDVARAADVLWTISSPEVYLQLTVDRGWSLTDYRSWLADTLQATLLRTPPRSETRPALGTDSR